LSSGFEAGESSLIAFRLVHISGFLQNLMVRLQFLVSFWTKVDE